MKINYVKGDMFPLLTNVDHLIMVPHVVNDAGRFGSGFAAAVMKHCPIVRERYMAWDANSERPEVDGGRVLGNVQYVVAKPNLVFANMVGQHGTVAKTNPKPIKYLALAIAMQKVAIAYKNSRFGLPFEFICPKFGAGLAQGNWDFIEELIEEIWTGRGIAVTVYYLED